MLFSDSVPEVILESPNTLAFLTVLDRLQEFKSLLMSDAIRGNNYAILNDKKWIVKHLSDFGVTDFPMDFPLIIMQQVLLNVGTLFSIRGSKIGLELFCSIMSLGEVEIDDSNVYVDPVNIILDSRVQGYATGSNKEAFFYLLEDSDTLNPETLIKIKIKSKYFNGEHHKEAEVIKRYISSQVQSWFGFSNARQEISFQSADSFFYHRLLNKYFI